MAAEQLALKKTTTTTTNIVSALVFFKLFFTIVSNHNIREINLKISMRSHFKKIGIGNGHVYFSCIFKHEMTSFCL